MTLTIPVQVFGWLGASVFFGLAGGLVYLYGKWCHTHPWASTAQVLWRGLGLSMALVLVYDIAFHITAGR